MKLLRRPAPGNACSQHANRSLSSLVFETLEDRRLLTCLTFQQPSSNGGDGTWNLEQRDGTDVHIGPAYLYYNLNLAVDFPDVQVGDTLYARVDYFDEGSGYLRVQYDSLRENFDNTDYHTRSSRVDTRQFVSSHHVLDDIQFANGTNGNDFRVATNNAPVSTVQICDEPLPGSGLAWVDDIPWRSPYSGPSRHDVDATTLDGKVLVGYQGWFKTPNDRADLNYRHWGQPGDWHVDQWPDPNDYDASELFAVPGTTTASGAPAFLFSSTESSVVRRHFQWMRQHDIDGVLLQRFSESFMEKNPDGSFSGPSQWPLVNARDAAHREGRTWSIEYDIQNAGDAAARNQRIQQVKDDWEFLSDPNGFDMLNDSRYQREDGKPVVAIFGLYVSSGNSYSTAQQADLISFFQSRGVYVIGAGRHSQNAGQIGNAGLHDAYIPWQGYWAGQNSYLPAEAALNGVTEHIPHVFPGFSWTHLQNDSNATSVDREDGEFYWRMLSDAINQTDAPWLFIGMFDEYDEATNLIPASDDPPLPDTGNDGNPLTFQTSDPMPNDWWMALTGEAKQALQGKAAISRDIPPVSELENRANVGGEVRWEVAAENRLSLSDSTGDRVETVEVTYNGETFDAVYSPDTYLHFEVASSFLWQETDGRDVTIEIEYLDSAVGSFDLQYDAVGQSDRSSASAPLTGSNRWRTHRFEIADAYFGNRQNGNDFRIDNQGVSLLVRRVRVLKESVLTIETDLGTVNGQNGLEQAEFAGDGQTVAVDSGGRNARVVTGNSSSLYMYFRVNDEFANQVNAGLNTVVEVVYQDLGTGALQLQYDGTGSAYQSADPIPLENSGEWRTTRFYLDNAFFGNRQNGNADFRLLGDLIPIDRVRVLRSFGDLLAPELQTVSTTVDSARSTVGIDWSMTEDWKSGRMERWTAQEDNHVVMEWTNDGGTTWNLLGEVYQDASVTAQNGYDLLAGAATWSDHFDWSTVGLPDGTYAIRMTPVDGRGNLGEALVTPEFMLDGSILGDFNQDGDLDVDDLDLLVSNIAIGPTEPAIFDLTGDGSVNLVDRDEWLVLAGMANLPSGLPYLLGDANLDGVVDTSDFNIWNQNKFETIAAWSAGDFNADGAVDASDFNIWNASKFNSSLGGFRRLPPPSSIDGALPARHSDRGLRALSETSSAEARIRAWPSEARPAADRIFAAWRQTEDETDD